MTVTDGRLQYVLPALADLSTRTYYASDIVHQAREPNGQKGEIIQVCSLDDITVHASGSTTHAAAAPTVTALSLVVDLDPFVNLKIDVPSRSQNLGGSWATEVATNAMKKFRSSIDQTFLRDYVTKTLAYDGSGTYHDNVAGDSLSAADILSAQAAVLDADDNIQPSDVAFFVHPFGQASIMAISTFIPNVQTGALANGTIGIRKLGEVYGSPVYLTRSVAKQRTIACTAVSISSNVATVTAALHGLAVGVKVTIAGITTPLTTATAITAVTDANTFTVPLTDSNGAMADGAGTVTVQSCENVVMNVNEVYVSKQVLPEARIVPLQDESGDALQLYALWGRIGRPGHARVLHSPPTST